MNYVDHKRKQMLIFTLQHAPGAHPDLIMDIRPISALQAAQSIEHITQEEPIVQSIWENQINPARHRSATPLFNPANPNNLLQTPALSWNVSRPSFMGSNTLLTMIFKP